MQDKAQDEGKQEEIQRNQETQGIEAIQDDEAIQGDEDEAIQSDEERVNRGKEAAAVSTEPGSHTIPTEPR